MTSEEAFETQAPFFMTKWRGQEHTPPRQMDPLIQSRLLLQKVGWLEGRGVAGRDKTGTELRHAHGTQHQKPTLTQSRETLVDGEASTVGYHIPGLAAARLRRLVTEGSSVTRLDH